MKVFYCILSVLLGLVILPVYLPNQAAKGENMAIHPSVLGDYDAEIREATPRADGIRHVDSPATIRKLKELHVNTYYYLIWHQKTDWDDLKNEFLPAAQKAGIHVVVYLTPPSESNGSLKSYPYTTNYVEWAKAIAQLSLKYPNLTGWAMDDFLDAKNLDTFTPSYMAEMQEAAGEINPDLTFSPVVYYRYLTPDFVNKYEKYFNNIIFPYQTISDTSLLPGELDHVNDLLKPYGKKAILMVYASRYSQYPYLPQADYVRNALQKGLNYTMQGKLAGVTTYALAKQPNVEACGVSFPNYLRLSIPDMTPTKAGEYGSASQTVQLDPKASQYGISFWETDSYGVYAPVEGFHVKQLFVNGQKVWEADVASDPPGVWAKQTVDLSHLLEGKTSATITFRLYENKGVSNFAIAADFANVQGQGFSLVNPDFSRDTGWTLDRTSDVSVNNAKNTYTRDCDPNREFHVFDAVRNLYGPADALGNEAIAKKLGILANEAYAVIGK